MKITRRILALLLAMCLLFGNVATPALAAGIAEDEIVVEPIEEIAEPVEEIAEPAAEEPEEEPAEEAEEEIIEIEEVAEEAAYYDATGAVDASLAAGEEISFIWTAAEAGTLKVTVAADPGYKIWIGNLLPKRGTAETTYEYEAAAGEEVTITITGYYDWEEVAAVVSYSVDFVASEGGDDVIVVEPGSSEVDYDVQLSLGANVLTLLNTVETTIYEFCPDEAGTYTFTADSAEALVGYWGSGSFFTSDYTENKTNTLEASITAVGQSIMVGISGVESCTLTVARTGDVNTEPEYEKVDYVNTVTPDTSFTLPVAASELIAVIPGGDIDTAVLGTDGYYHLNSANGPILYAKVNGQFAGAMNYGQVKGVEYNEDGSIAKLINYYFALEEYIAAADSSYYPLTADLIEMYQMIGENLGWYQDGSFTVTSGDPTAEDAWLFECAYVEPPKTGTQDNPTVVTDISSIAVSEETWFLYVAESDITLTLTLDSEDAMLDAWMYYIGDVENPDFVDENGTLVVELTQGSELYFRVWSDLDAFEVTVSGATEALEFPVQHRMPPSYTEEIQPAGHVFYAVRGVGGYNMVIEDADASVLYNGVTYVPVDGVVTVPMDPMTMGYHQFKIFNNGTEAKIFSIAWLEPVGSMNNPEVLTEGQHTASVPSWDAYWYTWTAEAEGQFTVTIDESCTNWSFQLMQNGYQFDTNYSDVEPVVNAQTIDVAAGDEIIIAISTADYNAADVTFTAFFNYPLGSEQNPIMTSETSFSVDVPAGETVYVSGKFGDMIFTLQGENVTVVNNKTEYESEDGVVTFTVVQGSMFDPWIFAITNEGETDATYAIDMAYPAGHHDNPLDMGLDMWSTWADLTADITDTNGKGVYYSWTATDRGTFTVTMGAGNENGWSYTLSKVNGDHVETGDTHTSYDDPIVDIETIEVNAGDVVQINVTTYAEDSNGVPSYPVGTVDFSVEFVAAKGSESNPYTLSADSVWNEAEKEYVLAGTIPANATAWFSAGRGLDNGILVVDGVERGTVTMRTYFSIENTTAEEKPFEVIVYFPLGHSKNPGKVNFGSNTAVTDGTWNGFLYQYVAEADGYFVVSMDENNENGWTYQIMNDTTWDMTDTHWCDDSPSVPTDMLAVSKGDVITLMVNTYDAETWGNPAGEVNFTVSMRYTGYQVAAGKSLTLKYTDPNTGKNVAASKFDWTIDECLVYTPDGDYVAYEDVASYASIKNGALKTLKCGDSVFLTVTAVSKTDASVSATYEVEILPASTKLSLGYYYDGMWTPVYGEWWWNASQARVELEIAENGFYEDWWDMDAYSYPDNSKQEVKWTSSNKKVATIDEDGVLRLVKDKNGAYVAGNTTITAVTTDGSNKKATFKLTVKKLASFVEISRKDGVALEELDLTHYDDEGNEIVETARVIYADAGTKVNLVATTDADVTTKGFEWGTYSSYGKVSNGTVTIDKNTPDNSRIWVNVYTKDFEAYDEVLIIVNNDKALAKSLDSWVEGGYGYRWMNEFDIEMDVSAATAEDLPYVMIRGYELDGSSYYVQDVENWTLSGKIASLEIVNYTDGDTVQTFAKVTPVWDEDKGTCSTGSVTLTGKSADGKLKVSYKINLVSLVNSLEIVTKDGKNMEDGVVYATAGTTVKLAAVTNANAKNKAVYWGAYTDEFYSDIKMSSSGVLTIGKEIPVETVIWVWAQAKDAGGYWTEIPVVVTPRATNVHMRTEIGDSIKYVSNATKNWDINTDGNELKLSTLVYPFEASQDVTWTVNNKNIAAIAENEDGTATLTLSGTKFGKLTVTATANDGSKEKTTFTLNVVSSVTSLTWKADTKDYIAGGKTLDLSKQVEINPANATNKKLTWSFSEDTAEAAAAIGAKISGGKLTSTAKLVTAPVTLTVCVASQDGYNAAAELDVTVYPASKKVTLVDAEGAELPAKLTADSAEVVLDAIVDGQSCQVVTWKSGKAAVATVEDGVVTAVSEGKVTITVTTDDGCKMSDKIEITFPAELFVPAT